MDYFDRLGASLQDAWSERGRLEEHFPDAAVEVLQRMPPAEALDRESLLDHLLDPRRPTSMQLAPQGAFGQPGFTVHHGHGFSIEVYHWLESLSAIHNHPFCGAFTILHGHSVHARYEVGPMSARGGRAYRTTVRLSALELVRPGDVVPFSLERHPLVHALVHVPRSSISMVVRTSRTEGYFRYLPPGIALPMEGAGEPRDRQLALLESLAATGDPRLSVRLQAMLEHADFELAMRLLSAHWPGSAPQPRAELLATVRARFGEDADAMQVVLDRALRLQEATSVREGLADPALRLVATALGYAELRSQVLGLLEAAGLEPVETLHRFVDEAGLYDEGEEASAIIAHVLVEGGGAPQALERLRTVYEATAIEGHEAEVEEYCRASIFAVLGEDQPSRK
ncbi:MAG: hypothetical protein AAF799_29955 [Myxococcota bacterium]